MRLNNNTFVSGCELVRLLYLLSIYFNYTTDLLEGLHIVFHGEKKPWEFSLCPPASPL